MCNVNVIIYGVFVITINCKFQQGTREVDEKYINK